ncbi:MAG TPA: hypothetical protein VFB72_09680 [Verrucomicrobiae bacterium]|nr:hypothetical protein [Verrucomicrobiae bacterium]
MIAITSPLSYATQSDSLRTVYAEQVVPKFKGTVVTWDATSTPITDEKKNVGLMFTGSAQGNKAGTFDIAVYREGGKLVIANIRKHH